MRVYLSPGGGFHGGFHGGGRNWQRNKSAAIHIGRLSHLAAAGRAASDGSEQVSTVKRRSASGDGVDALNTRATNADLVARASEKRRADARAKVDRVVTSDGRRYWSVRSTGTFPGRMSSRHVPFHSEYPFDEHRFHAVRKVSTSAKTVPRRENRQSGVRLKTYLMILIRLMLVNYLLWSCYRVLIINKPYYPDCCPILHDLRLY